MKKLKNLYLNLVEQIKLFVISKLGSGNIGVIVHQLRTVLKIILCKNSMVINYW